MPWWSWYEQSGASSRRTHSGGGTRTATLARGRELIESWRLRSEVVAFVRPSGCGPGVLLGVVLPLRSVCPSRTGNTSAHPFEWDQTGTWFGYCFSIHRRVVVQKLLQGLAAAVEDEAGRAVRACLDFLGFQIRRQVLGCFGRLLVAPDAGPDEQHVPSGVVTEQGRHGVVLTILTDDFGQIFGAAAGLSLRCFVQAKQRDAGRQPAWFGGFGDGINQAEDGVVGVVAGFGCVGAVVLGVVPGVEWFGPALNHLGYLFTMSPLLSGPRCERPR